MILVLSWEQCLNRNAVFDRGYRKKKTVDMEEKNWKNVN